VAFAQIARTALPKALYSLMPFEESSITTQRSPHLSIGLTAGSAGDQDWFVIGHSVLHRMCRHGSSTNHACDFKLGLQQRTGYDICLNVLPDICPAEVAEVRFHGITFDKLRDPVFLGEEGKKRRVLRLVNAHVPAS
jgi:hypothetical protein